MASIVGDESASEYVFALAALIGNDREWLSLERNWNKRTAGAVFHAAECESDRGDFCRYSHAENLSLYADLTSIIATSGVRGFGIALDLVTFREVFPSPPEMAYYWCFIGVVRHFAAEERYRDGTCMDFVFDHRQDGGHNVGALYNCFLSPDWSNENTSLGARLMFDSRKNIRIQAADLVARETMKAMDNIVGLKQRPLRRSMLALKEAGERFNFKAVTNRADHGFFLNWPDSI
ncbi:MAG: hypothetical protein WCE73_07780, partial [Candidatus Angelobacter sp.]